MKPAAVENGVQQGPTPAGQHDCEVGQVMEGKRVQFLVEEAPDSDRKTGVEVVYF